MCGRARASGNVRGESGISFEKGTGVRVGSEERRSVRVKDVPTISLDGEWKVL